MYKRILVPLDGSDLAEQVIPYVRPLGKGLQAEIELFRAVEHLPPEWMEWTIGVQPLQIAAHMSDQAQEYLDGIAASLANEGLKVSAVIRGGAAPSSIVSEAEKEPDTLLVMCTHGRSGITRWVLGSVADRVLHTTTNPLLIIRVREETAEPDVKLQTVVVPLDGSKAAEQVLPHVVSLARPLELKVILVRVSLPTEDYYRSLGYPVTPYGDLSREADTQVQSYFVQIGQRLRQQGVLEVEEQVLHGHPAEAIIDFSRGIDHNLVAMTTHGRSGVERWMLGSVTDRVVRYCGDPVLLVRGMD